MDAAVSFAAFAARKMEAAFGVEYAQLMALYLEEWLQIHGHTLQASADPDGNTKGVIIV